MSGKRRKDKVRNQGVRGNLGVVPCEDKMKHN